MTDALYLAGVALLTVLALVGLAVTVGQIRWWLHGRKAIRETERMLRGRHR